MSRWTGQEDFGDCIEKNGYTSISNLAFYKGIPFETETIMHDRVDAAEAAFNNFVEEVKRNGYHK